MNWIISKTKKLSCHTYLAELLKPIDDEIENYNWIISDFEYNGTGSYVELPINYDHDYFILSPQQFKSLVDINVQIYWGVILGVPLYKTIEVDENNLPFAEGNDLIWKNGNIQHPDAEIEVICYDSSCTIIKFRHKALSDKFKNYFTEAIELEKNKQHFF